MLFSISISTVASFDKAFETHLPDRFESMSIKKLLIRESSLFTAYMGFGFLIFPAGL